MSKEWYDENWKAKETPEFVAFWLEWYGHEEDYADPDEYWIRRGFALAGWIKRDEWRGKKVPKGPVAGTCCACGYSGSKSSYCPSREELVHCEHWWDGSTSRDKRSAGTSR